MRYIILLMVMLGFCACSTTENKQQPHNQVSQTESKVETTKETLKTQSNSQTEEKETEVIDEAAWATPYVEHYLKENKEHLQHLDGHPISFINTRELRDGRPYAAVKIGHNLEHRFQTSQWIYIDSISKQIYAYDLPNDELIPWPSK